MSYCTTSHHVGVAVILAAPHQPHASWLATVDSGADRHISGSVVCIYNVPVKASIALD